MGKKRRRREFVNQAHAVEAFYKKVNQTEGCWEWIGAKIGNGYGAITRNGRSHLAHRWIWMQKNGPIPFGMCVCHTCDNRACVRISHLFLGTQSDNIQDAANKGRLGPQVARKRRTHCMSGKHLWSAENKRLVNSTSGYFRCLACYNTGQRKWKSENR